MSCYILLYFSRLFGWSGSKQVVIVDGIVETQDDGLLVRESSASTTSAGDIHEFGTLNISRERGRYGHSGSKKLTGLTFWCRRNRS